MVGVDAEKFEGFGRMAIFVALGIFGAGNVGAAVTKFLAPMVMVAFGWKMVAMVWAAGLLVTAAIFWFGTKDDPQLAARRAAGAKPEPLSAMLEPLKNVQVWRFSLYYFFVFGAFEIGRAHV